MAAEIISGKELAATIRNNISSDVFNLKQVGIVPGLTVILVGNNPASRSYVTAKEKACQEIGIRSTLLEYPDTITEEFLLHEISRLNEDNDVHGILVQLPLPKQINELAVIEHISPEKDVDGFHPINVGRMMTGQDAFLPCTPFGIVEMVKSKQIPISGKHVVVIGRSNIVGKPVGQLFLNEHATVTYCHSRTTNLKEITKQADILIVAVGKANYIDSEYIKPGAVVIDVGVNRLESGKLCGDVLFEDAQKVAGYITPVPGGVGPMTITMLLQNTLLSAQAVNRSNVKG
ncbi:bifunctional methylenetetrahydrofolate dehydrogenase/methenyltetrahydrofolate cyclohydrolase FolD [Cytobacillus sp. S13-E01]|uniref:bifunctional methylenetetrahydrofolate dehydrogenase/methenyltetrahydrofolate cyclohydrolase FolD n=1 Tax=Cytobacillus sp. S13-E01 TaxID=3031326 RepID=UPI0023D8580A|nr:bifunctional methylenetetrahydrofolate dehydrogenase/methenyltetrahydrofolate cyclohydrolase FolD [Cytobacillus sp. S13-E01]MDF0727344.1 bifunctional methylenetetrahydrofolate dehydrogenase/methenyltetrahydrofolate cyclohydrolase FolD [Cytobacillus sp. S13-E01]